MTITGKISCFPWKTLRHCFKYLWDKIKKAIHIDSYYFVGDEGFEPPTLWV